jgi:Domain of unknown function (DUF4430)
VRPAPLLVVAVLVAGCSSTSSGRAVVWVTRDRGAHVLHVASVPAGLTAMQGLSRVAKVESRYGGRYVRSVDGVGEQGRKAWFYYVNGYLADRSAAEYRLHAGDVEWWDFRSWRDPAQDPVVVGAFPEPFLRGYGGKRRSTVILTSDSAPVQALARRLHATVTSNSLHVRGPNLIQIVPGEKMTARLEFTGSTSPGSSVRLIFTGDPKLLLRRWPFRFRYSVP